MGPQQTSTAGRPSVRVTGAERKRIIVEATQAVVGEHGVQGATTARIAAAAGISEKTLYSHFASRRDMLVAAMDAVFDRARKLAFPQGAEGSALENLRNARLSHNLAEGDFVYPLFEFFAAPPEAGLRQELKARHEVSLRLLIDLIEQGKTQGVIRPEADSEQTAWDLMAVYWADDVAYLLGFDVSDRTTVMAERIFREISA